MKTSRIPLSPGPIREPFGLVAIIQSKRTILPLKGVECDFSVVSGSAEVTMTQIFRQENEKSLDCEYEFPLPPEASVYHCEADINGRTIRAQVRERQEARRLAAEKKAAGYRTALVESERENLFTLSLGNAGAVKLILDGQELPPLGKAGQTALNVRLPSQGGSQERQVRSTEHPPVSTPRSPRH